MVRWCRAAVLLKLGNGTFIMAHSTHRPCSRFFTLTAPVQTDPLPVSLVISTSSTIPQGLVLLSTVFLSSFLFLSFSPCWLLLAYGSSFIISQNKWKNFDAAAVYSEPERFTIFGFSSSLSLASSRPEAATTSETRQGRWRGLCNPEL